MQIFESGQFFTTNYVAYDQNPSLNIGFSIYDVTTGTPIFIQTIAGTYMAFGSYSAQYIGAASKTYLAIGAAYTDDTFMILEQYRPPTCETYQAKNAGINFLAFAYGAYDENDSLFVRANVYDVTTGTPALIGQVTLAHVAIGTYFGTYVGTLTKNYEIDIAVYTDANYAEVDPNRSASCQSFNCILLSGVTLVLENAILEAQCLNATLVGGGCECFE